MVELLFGVFCLQKLSLSATIGKERKLFVLAKSKKKKKKKKKKEKEKKRKKKENRVKTTSSGKLIHKHRSIGRKIFAINFSKS
jgi:hypothetical protein